MRWTHVNSMPEGWSWMSKAWAENISDESIVDRYLTYCFDLNHNTEKDAPMTYDVHSIAEKIRKDISPKTKYHVGTVITWQVRFGGKGPLYHYAAVWTGKKTATTRARYTTLRYGAFRRPVRLCDYCRTSRGEVLGVVR